MIKFYVDMILTGNFNSSTNQPFTIEDVPQRRRAAVMKELEDNGERSKK